MWQQNKNETVILIFSSESEVIKFSLDYRFLISALILANTSPFLF